MTAWSGQDSLTCSQSFESQFDTETMTHTKNMLQKIGLLGSEVILSQAIRALDVCERDCAYGYGRQAMNELLLTASPEKKLKLNQIAIAINGYGDIIVKQDQLRGKNYTVGCLISDIITEKIKLVMILVITSKLAGADTIVVSSRQPDSDLIMAAYIAGADYFINFGSVHGLGALRFGFTYNELATPPCDFILGIGDYFEEAAKKVLKTEFETSVHFIGGPNQLLIVIDKSQTLNISAIVQFCLREVTERTSLYVFALAQPELDLFGESFQHEISVEKSHQRKVMYNQVYHHAIPVCTPTLDSLSTLMCQFSPEKFFAFGSAQFKRQLNEKLDQKNFLGGYLNNFCTITS